ncbi:MAG: hypothetical protein ABJG68_15190 [Crocinitomicaceae bacterium]
MKNLNNIILVGPLATGKSTVAEHLSNITGLRNVPVDKVKWHYRFQNGYDLVKSRNILRSNGFDALLDYAKDFFGPNDLKDVLSRFEGIIDFGATDTHSKDLSRLAEIYKLLDPYPNIFLILPYEDESLSEEVLEKRLRKRLKDDPLKGPVLETYLKKNREFLYSPNSIAAAKHVIYTNDRPFHHIAQEIYYKCDFAGKGLSQNRKATMVS